MTAYHRLTAGPEPKKPASGPGRFARMGRSLAGAALLCALFALPGQALAVNDDAVLRRMDTVLEENARLRDEAWKSRKNGREAAKQAEEALNASDERLEKTRTEALAHVAGVSPAQVEGLRRDGRSWGQAAGDLGVHPGFLGIGKAPLYEPQSAKRKAAAEAAQAKRAKKGKAEPAVKKGAKESAKKPGKDAGKKAPAKATKGAPKAKAAAKEAPKAPVKGAKKAKKTQD